MASPPPTTQKASRWGSFLAGVESRLDTILADDDTASGRPKSNAVPQDHAEKKDASAALAQGKAKVEGFSRSSSASSTNRAQDRLNEKLAKAMANRNLNRMNDKSPAASNLPSRTESPVNGMKSERQSVEISREGVKLEQEKAIAGAGEAQSEPTNLEPPEPSPVLQESEIQESPAEAETPAQPRSSTDSAQPISVRQSLDLTRSTTGQHSAKINGTGPHNDIDSSLKHVENISQMKADYEAAELRRQEEMHVYLERIDTLQSKLQYLTKEAAEFAKQSKLDAQPGSLDEKIAVKDEKIALLMEEGHKLSQTELKHMNIIKKLRAKATDDERRITDERRLSERHEKTAKEAKERAKRAEESERRAIEKSKILSKLEFELENTTRDGESKDRLIQDLQTQLSDITSAARLAEEKAQVEALESERKRVAQLSDELTSLKIEKELAEKQHQAEIRGLKEKSEREKERARVAEIERQGEQNILESRLEAFRARAEEASAGSHSDVQAKLLRQIETLQNQYAIASENWQGIEGSLLARVTTLEKERDELGKREADVRKKARESNLRSRRAEEELERVAVKAQDTDYELAQQKSQLKLLHDRISEAEADALAARKELDSEREAWDAKQAQMLDEERARQKEDSTRTPETLYQQFRPESPVASSRNRKNSNADKSGSHHRRLQGLAISGTGHSPRERSLSRRSSSQPFNHPDLRPTSRQDSISFMGASSGNVGIPETPSIQVDNQDDLFDGIKTPATPERTINDMISVSTAGAGPSVQLVERMSAAVRRLESEKAVSKDEIARLSVQRDEARDQAVGLMREVEEKRSAEERVKKLEKEVAEINERYLTTLEMLGEKSEKVEELKADVADVKQMYRELVDNTMR